MAVTVRRVRADEGARLRDVRLRALEDAPLAFASTLEEEARLGPGHWDALVARSADGPLSANFVAEDESGEFVGLVAGFRQGATDADVELVSMWVAPVVRGRGIGAELVEAVAAWVRATGGAQVSLWVARGNDPAQSLYAASGFEATAETQPLPSHPCRDEVRMVRALRDGPGP